MYKFPVYDKETGKKIHCSYFNIVIDEPIDSTEMLHNYLTNVKLIDEKDVINSIDNIINSIKNNKIYKDLFNNCEINLCKTSTKFNIMKAFNKIPDHYKYNYEKLKNDAIKELENSFKKSCYWIHDNKLEIIEFLKLQVDSIINLNKERKRLANLKYYEANKERKCLANLKYYQAKKEADGIPSKTKMSDEQKKENKRLANLKYYQKNKSGVALHQADN